jgi:transcription initiation factor TFIIIB Brf1 subunit/transcription initiation factor TFIIB
MNSPCNDCGSFSFVEDYSDGSVVCTGCGLIACPFLLDDRPLFDATRNVNSTAYVPMESDPIHLQVQDAFYRLNIESEVLVYQTVEFAKDFKEANEYRGHLDTLLAYATYDTCKKNKFIVSRKDICSSFGIDSTSFDNFLSNYIKTTSDVVNVQINERIACIASTLILDRHKRMQVIKTASKIEARLKSNKDYLTKKPSKMDSVILFYVCTKEFGMKLKKKDYIKDAGVSGVTFSKHLKFIESCM